jgi:uncharacterized repeat protein (TIGR01451 family)
LESSSKQAGNPAPASGETLTYTIELRNPGPLLENVTMTDTLPADVTYAGNLIFSSGVASEAGGVITWSGEVSAADPVVVQFDVTVSEQIVGEQVIVNTALIDDGQGNEISRQATVIVNGHTVYLPFCSS